MTRPRPFRFLTGLVFTASLVLTPLGAGADGAPGDGEMLDSLEQFSVSWIQKLKRSGLKRPNGFTEYSTPVSEVKPTGHKQAPYVGIIRYTERKYRCADLKARRDCVLAATTPVTEIFRFQDGRWIY